MKRELTLTVDDPKIERALNEQIRRLRQMLVLMAPETGSSAFGAARNRLPEGLHHVTLPALTDQRH